MISSSDILHGKILIVDDQEVNVLLLERMLRGAGYVSITSTMDPGEVCDLHLKNRYDLILLDLQMPGMDGFQVMEGLKDIEPDGYLPVLVITAQPAHKLRALEAGAKDFISKPIELAELLARVHNMLEVRLLHKELQNYNDALEKKVRERTAALQESYLETISAAKFPSEDPNPVLRLSRDGIVMYANAASGALLGMWGCAVGGSAPQFWRDLTAQALANRENKTVDIECDGKVYSIFVTPVAEPGYVNLYGGDITERKRAEVALAASESELRALIASMRDVVLVIDREGIIREIAPTSPAVWYVPRQELLGKRLQDVLPAEQSEVFWGVIQQVLDTKRNTQIEYELIFGKQSVWYEASISPMSADSTLWVARDITERKRAEEALRRRADEFAALYETTDNLSVQYELSALLQTIADNAARLVKSSSATMYLYDSASDELELTVETGFPLPVGARLKMGEGMAGRVAQSRKPQIVDDYQTWESRSSLYEGIPYRAVAEVPMLYGGNLIGVLAVAELGESLRKYSEADLRLLSLFAGPAAGAVHNARLLDEARRRLAELEALHAVSAALRNASTRDEALPLLLDETLAALETEAGVIWLYHPEHGELRAAVARGWFRELSETPMKSGEGIGGTVYASGQTHLSTEFRSDPLARSTTREPIPPGWGGACLPIRAGAVTIGVLYVSLPLPRQITPGQVRLLESLAEMVGAALHRMRLHEETVRHLDQLRALRAIDTAIASSLDLRVTLSVVLDQVATQLGVDAASILLLNPYSQTLEYVAGRGFRTRSIEQSRVRLGEGPAGRAALDRQIVVTPDLSANSPAFARAALLTGEAFITHCGAPLIAKGQVVGVLEIFHRTPLKLDPEWLSFLEALAGQAAIAVDSASLFADLQRSNTELFNAFDSTIEGWSHALDLRDKETENHTLRVTEITLKLARAAGMTEAELVHVRRGALLHDIGKMGVPDNILLKSDKLTDEEWVAMRKHPTFAFELLSPIAYLRPALDIPYYHHEKWDGSGYPRGLKGGQIPLAARLFAIVDVWDALTSDRPYRKAWPKEKVIEHIKAGSGAHFDPKAVELFLKMMSEEAHQHGQGAG